MIGLSKIFVSLFIVWVVMLFISCQTPTVPSETRIEPLQVTLNQIQTVFEKGLTNHPPVLIRKMVTLIDSYHQQVMVYRSSDLMKANLPHTVLMSYNAWIVTYQYAEDLQVRN
jgi:hypothetical protein